MSIAAIATIVAPRAPTEPPSRLTAGNLLRLRAASFTLASESKARTVPNPRDKARFLGEKRSSPCVALGTECAVFATARAGRGELGLGQRFLRSTQAGAAPGAPA